ncbi:hypothetical protein VDG1235_2883 [Verrucomicrobiia bacterium DG1235]|nr:hypothetical protein VDG1235_2883 [Verrucomicrobiae bacterium DG1235]
MEFRSYKVLPKPLLNKECITCTQPEHDDRIIAFTQLFKVLLHPDQTSIGSVLIASRRHVGQISGFGNEEKREFIDLISDFEVALEAAFGADLINIYYQRNWAYRSINPDPPLKDGKPNPHVHLHVIPRYSKKVSFEEEEWVDQSFGEPFIYQSRPVSNTLKEKVIRRIQGHLNLEYE